MSNTHNSTRGQSGLPFLVLGILILLVDGFDLFVFGAVAPVMLEYAAWNVSPALVGLIGSLPPLTAPLGAILGGYAADVYGRRLPVMVSLIWASACMIGSFLSPTLGFFMATRLAAGLGLGALIPLTVAFVCDRAPERRVTLYTCAALTGIAGGGIIVALTGRALLPELQFQWLFLFGSLGLLLLPAVWRLLPSSVPAREPASLTEPAPAEHALAESAPTEFGSDRRASKLRQLFAPGLAGTTIAFWVATFLALVLIFGASTWLPTLMVNSGYDISSSLEFAVTFNIGAIVGTLLVALVADRWSLKWVTVACFGVAVVSMFVLSTPQPRLLLLIVAAFAGLGALGTQNLINSYVASFYPARLRGTALGFSLGIGRLGAIVGLSYLAVVVALVANPDAGFYAFMIPALLGALVIAAIPTRRQTMPNTVAEARVPGERERL